MDHSQNPERPDSLNPSSPPGEPRSVTPGSVGLPGDASGPPAAPPPLTPMAWLMNNGIYLLVILALVVWVYKSGGVSAIWQALLMILGLGFVVFIHELGHFLAAKWCDVHVQTFSIGFGPALPGCSFQKGETTYKIALLPLGGYVNMVGEGTDSEEGEDYPRSFKNKTVGQRMLIISAGVIMNVLLGAVCFVVVYLFHGVNVPPAEVYRVDTGSPAWEAGVRSDSVITQIGTIHDPTFKDLKYEVALSDWGRPIPFTFKSPYGDFQVKLEPRKDPNDQVPVIGVMPPARLKLPPKERMEPKQNPYGHNSAASFARVLELAPGDVLLKSSTKGGELAPLPEDQAQAMLELCRRMTALKSEPLELVVRKKNGKTETEKVAAVGFLPGDTIVATTDPDRPDQPFQIKELPLDPTQPTAAEDHACSPYEFRKRLRKLAGKPMVIQVLRDKHGTEPPVSILVPPSYHWTLGLDMKMGEVAAVRRDSPAAKAGMQPATATIKGDELKKIEMVFQTDDPKNPTRTVSIPMKDPTRLPYELARAARERPVAGKPVKVKVTVLRPNPNNGRAAEDHELPMTWDDSWDFQEEGPFGLASPMSIPQLGIAYWVQTTVTEVKKDGPAAQAGIQKDDVFEAIASQKTVSKAEKEPEGEPSLLDRFWKWLAGGKKRGLRELKMVRGPDGKEAYDSWAHVYWTLSRTETPDIKVMVRRGDKLLDDPIALEPVQDPTWPLEDRGLLLLNDLRLQKADSVMGALKLGLDETGNTLKQMYLTLRSLFNRRISTSTLGGPLMLGQQAFYAAEDPYVLILFLGMISLNLAVVNFLPIPVLDGGHMVFLIYEKLRGRPPSEMVHQVATYAGLVLILSLMVFVFWLDIKRLLF